MGCRGKGTSPKWAGAPPPKGPCALGFGGNPKGGAPLAWGASPLPLGRRPPSGSHLEGAGPPCPSPINRGVRGGLHTQVKAQPLPSPTPLLLRTCLAKPCRSTAAPTAPRRRAAVGVFFLNLSFPLLDQEGGDVARPVRVLNAEVLSVQHLAIGDSNHDEYDYVITIPLNASARNLQVVCRCNLSPITRCLDELIDGSW